MATFIYREKNMPLSISVQLTENVLGKSKIMCEYVHIRDLATVSRIEILYQRLTVTILLVNCLKRMWTPTFFCIFFKHGPWKLEEFPNCCAFRLFREYSETILTGGNNRIAVHNKLGTNEKLVYVWIWLTLWLFGVT